MSKNAKKLILFLCLAQSVMFARSILAQEKTESTEKLNSVEGAAREPGDQKERNQQLPWLDSMATGYRHAQQKRQPIFVRVGGESCPFCKLLEQEIKKAEVQSELKRWTLVEIDVDESPNDARFLAVGPIPALRLLTPSGKLVQSRDGEISGEELVDWLQQHYDEAAVIPAEELTQTGPPNLLGTVRLIRQFQQRDATLREAAVRRLLPHPQIAASPVVSALTEGNLSTRLMSLELLQQWKAPVEGLDPWRPASITDEHIDRLSEWASAIQAKEPAQDEDEQADRKLTPDELSSAKRMIAKMVTAESVEARAVRERLAGFGPALLPEVYRLLKVAETDLVRERLTALRYRLVASDVLVLNWSGGLERLAATDQQIRQSAADELSRRATADEESLLLELFSDPAPLVREISLRSLQEVGGGETQGALLGLLSDPEPNVRAAVLKQLAEHPSMKTVPKIAEYVAQEKDADLVVHAVRLLREAGGKTAAESLTSLLKHESWQVRSEAAEALGKITSRLGSQEKELKVNAYMALIDSLKDKDAFVVSRSVTALSEADLAAAIDPLAEVAATHPALADEVISTLSNNYQHKSKVIPHLRKYCGHEKAKVRAAAITGLCSLSSQDVEQELHSALNDSESVVRAAAANALFQLLDNHRDSAISEAMQEFQVVEGDVIEIDSEPTATSGVLGWLVEGLFGGPKQSKKVVEPVEEPPAGKQTDESEEKADEKSKEDPKQKSGDAPENKSNENAKTAVENDAVEEIKDGEDSKTKEDDFDAWLREVRQGQGQGLPKWMLAFTADLQPLLKSDSPEERLAGAKSLVALGQDEVALPVLQDIAGTDKQLAFKTAGVLPWLLWEDRKQFFELLASSSTEPSQLSLIAYSITKSRDPRNADLLWSLFAIENASEKTVSVIEYPMRDLYFSNYSYDPTDAPARMRRKAIEDIKPRTESGTRWQRTFALAMLLPIAGDDVAETARKIVNDMEAEADFRADAFQILLLAESDKDAQQTAVNAIVNPNPEIARRALSYLTMGKESLASLQEGAITLDRGLSFSSYNRFQSSDNKLPLPEAPEGLNAAQLQPLRNSADPEIAARAAYLLVLLGHPDALDSLIDYWRRHAKEDSRWTRLVYQAIAYLDDASRVELLQEIFEQINTEENGGDVRDFYWSIRSMTGPKILGLRKKIRDTVGMDNLR